MKRVAVLSILLFVLAGCNSASDYLGDAKLEATQCAKNWKAQGYNFDPNCITCSQMFKKVAAIRRAEYWKERGYHRDPNLMTREEIDQKVKDIDRARYWKEKGYDFDPNCMTAQEMDQQAEELDKAKRWEKRGYYYDPNSQTVFLSAQKRTKLKSLAGIHGTASIRPSYRTGSRAFNSFETRATGFLDRRTSFDNLRHSPSASPSLVNLPPLTSGLSASSPDLGGRNERGRYLGQWSANQFDPHSIGNPFGAGNRFNPNSINNEFGKYGSKFSPYSPWNPFATNTPKLYDSQGNYRGKLSNNPFDPDSICNPFGRYGNRFSLESVNNPFSLDSPNNPFGQGLSIFGEE